MVAKLDGCHSFKVYICYSYFKCFRFNCCARGLCGFVLFFLSSNHLLMPCGRVLTIFKSSRYETRACGLICLNRFINLVVLLILCGIWIFIIFSCLVLHRYFKESSHLPFVWASNIEIEIWNCFLEVKWNQARLRYFGKIIQCWG